MVYACLYGFGYQMDVAMVGIIYTVLRSRYCPRINSTGNVNRAMKYIAPATSNFQGSFNHFPNHPYRTDPQRPALMYAELLVWFTVQYAEQCTTSTGDERELLGGWRFDGIAFISPESNDGGFPLMKI